MAKTKEKAKKDQCPQCEGAIDADNAISYEDYGPFCGLECVKAFQKNYLDRN